MAAVSTFMVYPFQNEWVVVIEVPQRRVSVQRTVVACALLAAYELVREFDDDGGIAGYVARSLIDDRRSLAQLEAGEKDRQLANRTKKGNLDVE